MQTERKLIVAQTRGSPFPMPRGCTVEEVMTREVLSFRPDTSLQTAAEQLFERGIGGAPVVDVLGNLVGILSKTDLVGERLDAEAAAPTEPGMMEVEGTLVSEVMTSAPVVIRAGTSISEAAALLTGLKLHRVPVVSETGALVGILTSSDVVRWVAGLP